MTFVRHPGDFQVNPLECPGSLMRRGRSCAWPDVAARLPDVARTSSHRGSGEPGEAHATMQGAAESTPMARITGRQHLWTSPLASLFTRTGEMGSEFPRATIIRDMRLWLSAGHGTAVLQTIFETNTVDQAPTPGGRTRQTALTTCGWRGSPLTAVTPFPWRRGSGRPGSKQQGATQLPGGARLLPGAGGRARSRRRERGRRLAILGRTSEHRCQD